MNFVLDGARVWRLLDGSRSFEEIVAEILKEHALPNSAAEEVGRQLAEFLGQLSAAGLVTVATPAP